MNESLFLKAGDDALFAVVAVLVIAAALVLIPLIIRDGRDK